MANRTVSVKLMAEVGQYVGGMNKAAAATMRLGDSATKSTAQAKSGFDIASKGALIMGGAVVAGLGMAVSSSMRFEKSMSAVQAATQSSTAALGDLRDAAMRAGADTQYSATEAADAITEMAKAGVSAKDIMGGGLSGALNLAAAGQLEVADAAEIAATALSVFGLEGSQMGHVADLLAAGAGKAQGSVADMSAALNQSALVAKNTGLSIDDTTGALALFASKGLLGSDAGTSFRTMLMSLTPKSDEAAKAMDEMGLRAYDASGNFVGLSAYAQKLSDGLGGMSQEQRNATLQTIFGSDAIRAATILYESGAKGVDEWAAKVNDAGFAQRQAADLTDNLSGDLERLGGAFDTLMINMGSGAQGPLRDVVQMMTDLLGAVGWAIDAFSSIPTPVLAAAAAFAGVAALRGPMSGFLTTMHEKAVMGAVSLLDIGRSADNAKGALSRLSGAFSPINIGIGSAMLLFPAFINLVKGLTQNSADAAAGQRALADALRATNGVIDDNARAAARQQLVAEGLVGTLKAAGVSSKDAIDGLLGNAAAQERVNDALKDYLAQGVASGEMFGKQVIGANEAQDKYLQLAEALGMSKDEAEFFADSATGAAEAATATGDAAAGTVPQVDEATKALEEWRQQLQEVGASFVEPLSIYKGLLEEKSAAEREAAEKTASSTESSSDSWKDYVGDVTVSLDEYATALEEQLAAQESWRQNIGIVTQRGGIEVGQILASMGVEGAQITAQMATATAEDFERMKNDLIREAQGATAGLDHEMTVMAAIGAAGAGATALAIAQKLDLGLADVQAIAAKYGIALATGLDPLLTALGSRTVALRTRGEGMRNGANYAEGGYTGPGSKYTPAGIVHAGEYVLTKEQTSRLGIEQIEAFANQGYASGGFVTASDVPRPPSTAPYGSPISTAGDLTMKTAYDETVAWMKTNGGGIAGTGSLGSGVASMFAAVRAAFPQANLNSGYRLGDPGYHGRGKAIDLGQIGRAGGDGHPYLAAMNRWLYDNYGANLAELIYDGVGDDRPDLKNGKPHTYSPATREQHKNHVHAAVGGTREFSGFGGGGGGGGGGGTGSAVPPVVTVFAQFGEETIEARAVRVVTSALTGATDRGRYNS